MSNIDKNHLSHFIINIVLTSLLIISCILIFAQTIINIKYNHSKNKSILSEKLVYEQFSHDVYSNINSKIYYDFEVYPFSDDCPEDKEPIIFSIKLDSYYDCTGINLDNIDDNCKDKITDSLICCQKDCCENDKCRNKQAKNMVDEEKNDTRKDNCVYYNKYNGKFSQIVKGYKICARKYNYDYHYLLYLSQTNDIKDNDCLYLDSYNHCVGSSALKGNLKFELSNITFNLNNKKVIVKNIFSEITPNYFEYEILLKEWILNNKNKKSNNDEEEVNKYKELNIENIYNTFFKGLQESFTGGNIYYTKQKEILLEKIINSNSEPVFENYLSNSYIKLKNTTWYTRNYIGFKNLEEFVKFKENFDENDVTNNPLYKISKDTLYPNIESIFVILIFLSEFIISFIIQIKSFLKEKTIKVKNYLISDSLTQMFSPLLLIIYFFIYLFKYVYKYKKISIEMEIYYQLVLDQYNKRRNQDCLLAGIIILFITFILIFTNYIIMVKIYDVNGINTPSGYTIICILKNSENDGEYKFKFYLNRKFSVEKERFKEKFFKNYDIEECKFKEIKEENEKEIIIDENKKVGEIGLKNESIIYVVCEKK